MGQAIWNLTRVGVAAATADSYRLRDVTLTIVSGITAVLGPSGAGKTTLLNLLVGFEKPSEGMLEACGLKLASDPDLKPQASKPALFWSPPDHGLWPHLTVRQHLEAAACEAFRGRGRGRIDEMLGEFDLLDHAHHRPDHLSQGQRSRLSVARALVTGAGVLVMDEPLVHIGPERAEAYWSVIRRVLDQTGASLVFSTHDAAVAQEHADRAIRLDEGRVAGQEVSGPDKGESPTSPRTAWALAGALLVCISMIACDGAEGAPLPVEKVAYHSIPPDGAKVPAPRDVAPGPLVPGGGDELLVIDNAGRILVMDRSGQVQRWWRTPSNEHGNPEGACALRDGRIAVADTHYFRLLFYDTEGKLLSMLGERGHGPGQFIYPVKIVEDDKGNFYVAEYGGNDRVQKFAADGTHLLSIGSFGTSEGQFQRPSGLIWHDGKLYIADAINNRVLIYSDEGKYLGVLGPDVPLKFPYDLSRGPDGLFYIIEYGAGRLTVIDGAGQLVGRFGGSGAGADQLATPWGLTVDDAGTVWIADTGNRRIVEVRR